MKTGLFRILCTASSLLGCLLYSQQTQTVPMEQMVTVQMEIGGVMWGGWTEYPGDPMSIGEVFIYAEAPTPQEEDDLEVPGRRGGVINEEYPLSVTWAHMVPWKSYDMLVTRSDSCYPIVTFKAPQGYDVVVDGMIANQYKFSAPNPTHHYVKIAKVQVVPKMAHEKARTGVSTAMKAGKIAWNASLGESSVGDSAGIVYLHDAGKKETWEGLASFLGVARNTPEVYVLKTPCKILELTHDGIYKWQKFVDGDIAQIVTTDSIIDVANENDRMALRFYTRNQVEDEDTVLNWDFVFLNRSLGENHFLEIGGSIDGREIRRHTFHGKPYIEYLFELGNEEGVNSLEITKNVYPSTIQERLSEDTAPVQTQTSKVIKTNTPAGFHWRVEDWMSPSLSGIGCLVISSNTTLDEGGILHEYTQTTQEGSPEPPVTFYNKYVYFPGLSEVLYESNILGLHSKYGFVRRLLAEQTYMSNTAYMKNSTGYMEVYEWETGQMHEWGWMEPDELMRGFFPFGFLRNKYTPFLDNASDIVDEHITKGGMHVEYTTSSMHEPPGVKEWYPEWGNTSYGPFDHHWLSAQMETHYLTTDTDEEVMIGRKIMPGPDGDLPYREKLTLSFASKDTVLKYWETNHIAQLPVEMRNTRFPHDYNGLLTNRPYSETHATGKKVNRTYQFGTYVSGNNIPGAFTPDQYYKVGNLWLRPYAGPGFMETATTSHNGTHINGLSTRTEIIRDKYAHVKEVREYICQSNVWNLISWELRDYNDANQLTRVLHSSGREETYEYHGEYKTLYADGNGQVIRYEYDNLGRLTKETIDGQAGVLGNLTTTYQYNALGSITRKTVKGSGEETLDYECEYDQHGRKTREKNPGTGWVRFSYDIANRTETTTFPDDSWKTEEKYIDGRLKSITGNAAINEHHHYYPITDANSPRYGFIVHETRIGSDNNSPENSPRVTTETKDWLGRVVERTVPAAPGQGNTPQVETYHYHPDTGLLLRKEITGGPATLYRYNQFGELIEEAIRVDNTLSGDAPNYASSDQITRTTYEYKAPSIAEDLGLWYKETNSYTYGENTAGTPTSTPIRLSTTKDYIINQSALPPNEANLRSYTISINADGHSTWQKTYVYPQQKKTITQVGGNGIGTTTTTHINGLLVETQNPDGLIYRSHYDPLWRITANEDPRTGNSTITYLEGSPMVRESRDPANRLISRNHYDPMGRVIQVDDPLGKSMYTQYSPRGEPLRIWGQTTNPVSYTYDQYGVKTGMRTYRDDETLDWTTDTWPAADTHGDLTQWHYHPATGLLLSKTDAANKTVSYTYDQLARVKTKTLAREVSPGVPLTLSYHYYGDNPGELKTGQLKTITYNDNITPATTYTYNRLGKLLTVTESHIGTRRFTYNATHPWRVETEQLPAYLGNRLLTQLYQNGANNTVPGRIAGYQLGNTQNPAAELQQTYTYNTSNARITTITAKIGNQAARSYHYSYHAQAPLLSGMSISDSPLTTTRHFDPHRNLVTTLDTRLSNHDTPIIRNQYHHDNHGRRDRIMHNGTAYADYGTGKALLRHIAYNDRSEVTQDDAHLVDDNTDPATHNPDPATALANRRYRYTYDPIGNRKTSSRNADQDTATYQTNNLNQYTQRQNAGTPISGTTAEDTTIITHQQNNPATTQAATQQLTWWTSTIPNPQQGSLLTYIITAGRPANPAHESPADHYTTQTHTLLIPPALQEYTYDADGNLLSDGLHSYHWDAHDRLVKIQTTHLSTQYGATPRAYHYTYDYLGRRIAKKIEENNTLLTETRYHYKAWDLLAEYTINNNQHTLHRSYAWGLDLTTSLTGAGGVGALLQIHDHNTNATYHPAYDANGNLLALINHQDNTQAATYEYSPYGELIRATGPYAQENPIRFATQYHDNETNLVYYHKRYYSPDMGRFINRDPIEEKGGLNLYAYCNNNAINTWDLLGMVSTRSWLSQPDPGTEPSESESFISPDAPEDDTSSGESNTQFDSEGKSKTISAEAMGKYINKQFPGAVKDGKVSKKILDKVLGDLASKGIIVTPVKSETKDSKTQQGEKDGPADPATQNNAKDSRAKDQSNQHIEEPGKTKEWDPVKTPKLIDSRAYPYSMVYIVRKGNDIIINVPIIYQGDSEELINDKLIADFEKSIKQEWEGKIGKYNVTVNFLRGGYTEVDKLYNTSMTFANIVYFSEGSGNAKRSWTNKSAGVMTIYIGDIDDAAPHEFGHLMWNRLHYDKKDDPNFKNHQNNVMIKRGGIVEEINIDEAIERWGKYGPGFKKP